MQGLGIKKAVKSWKPGRWKKVLNWRHEWQNGRKT